MMRIFEPTPLNLKKLVAVFSLALAFRPIFSEESDKVDEVPAVTSYDYNNELDDSVRKTPEDLVGEEVEEEDIPPEEMVVENQNQETDLPADDKKVDSQEAVEVKDVPNVRNGYTHVDIGLSGLENDLTQSYINYYQGSEGRKLLVQALKNSVPYRPYIINSLEKNKLPLFLQYIPVIESDYKYTAVSRSGATGIWQFMANSMAPLMKKGKWFDDRRDPWISTDAAMLKFKDNYGFFKDWSLAMAAYNCGAGALLKLVKANPGDDFWDLAAKGLLKTETTRYVPKLIAVAEIVENAGYYGLKDVQDAAALINGKSVEEFDYLPTKAMLTFKQLSDVTGLSVDRIKQLNPALLKDCTPMGENYKLRLPKGYAKGLKEKLRKKGLSTDSQIHKVEKGDTLWAISRKYGVTVSELCKANGMEENSVLSIGKELVVPIF